MHSLAQEIQGFSKNRLKKQSTCVTTVTGKKLLERRSDGSEGEAVQVEELQDDSGCGFVEDTSLDLQVGVVRPFLLLGNFSDYDFTLLPTLDPVSLPDSCCSFNRPVIDVIICIFLLLHVAVKERLIFKQKKQQKTNR